MLKRGLKSLLCLVTASLMLLAASSLARADLLNLPVPTITIYPGDVVSRDLLTVKKFRMRSDRLPVFRSADAAIGKVASRTLIAGKPIPINHLRAPQLVKQGKQVRIVFSEGGLTISGVGIALQSGGEGELLSVRNVDSGTVIRGTVKADGSIRIAGP